VNFPKGSVWQTCRDHALNSIVDNSSFTPHNPLTLSSWRQRGSFSVVAATAKSFTLECATADIGSAIVGDTEHLLNHIAEHRALIHDSIKTDRWNSPAWLLVTIYYWGLFAALAWTRLLGKGVVYLDQTAVRDLRTLARNAMQSPHSGTFQLKMGRDLSATNREVVLDKMGSSHFHACTWSQVIRDAQWRFDHYATEETNKLEFSLFKCLAFSDRAGKDSWPSELRNRINYRPGFAYTQVNKKPALDLIQFIRKTPFHSMEAVADIYELELRRIAATSSIDNSPSNYSRIMFLKTIVLTSLVEELFSEVVERRKLDARGSNKRHSFYKERGMRKVDNVWPIDH
jgi:hypothetical protein